MHTPKISFTGKNLQLLLDVVQDAIANVNNEIGLAQHDEGRASFAEVKAEYEALRDRIKHKLE